MNTLKDEELKNVAAGILVNGKQQTPQEFLEYMAMAEGSAEKAALLLVAPYIFHPNIVNEINQEFAAAGMEVPDYIKEAFEMVIKNYQQIEPIFK